MRKVILILLLPTFMLCQELTQDQFFNTKFLSDYDLVEKTLIEKENFEAIQFPSSDGLIINGLLRLKPHAKSSIIFCAGFYPGRKEGLATFIRMVPEDMNILFFDARGHGKSAGRFFSALHRYGLDEYKDVQGAITYMQLRTNNLPIIIHGLCAGAFHASHAISQLKPEQANIKGLIFDSGLTSLYESRDIPEHHFKEKVIPGMLQAIYKNDSKQMIKNRYLYMFLSACMSMTMHCIKEVLNPWILGVDEQTRLMDAVENIKCPILFIHAKNDTYSSIDQIQELAKKAKNSTTWWIESSEHALNHLKHTTEYKTWLNQFLSTLNT